MEPRVEPLAAIIALNTDLVLNCCSDLAAPIPGGTLLAMIPFLVQQESPHLGQMAFIRRWLGYDAMSYKRRNLVGDD